MDKAELSLNRYEQNINRVINFITENAHRDITLDEMAKVACFSKFHFHRIFRALVGETAAEFKRRLQLERAAQILIFRKQLPITDIALECGFSSSQNFAKAFKLFFGRTPSLFRQEEHIVNKSNTGNINSKPGNENTSAEPYILNNSRKKTITLQQNDSMKDEVKLEKIPEMHLLYKRHLGEYTFDSLQPLYKTLFQEALQHDLLTEKTTVLGICWDYVAVTEVQQCRYDACLTLPDTVRIKSNWNVQTLPEGRYAIYRCRVKNRNFHHHWNRLLHDWLPSSGLELDNRPSLEIFHELRDGEPHRDYQLDICLPLKG